MRNGLTFTAGLLAAALAGVAGCARFHDRPLSAEKVSANFEIRSLGDAGLKAFLERKVQAERSEARKETP